MRFETHSNKRLRRQCTYPGEIQREREREREKEREREGEAQKSESVYER